MQVGLSTAGTSFFCVFGGSCFGLVLCERHACAGSAPLPPLTDRPGSRLEVALRARRPKDPGPFQRWMLEVRVSLRIVSAPGRAVGLA